MNRRRRGMVLGIVVLTLIVLGAVLFAFQQVARQQNLRAHREQIAGVASLLAVAGVNLLAEQLGSSIDGLVNQVAPRLKTEIMVGNPAPPVVIDSSDRFGSVLRTVRNDFDALLAQLRHFPSRPVCSRMELSFEQIRQITPGTDRQQMQAGRDPVEKLGEMVISCTVEYQGLARKAQIRRQFRVVSMVPGPFARFTLFAPYTPSYNSFNSLGVTYSGQVDGGYRHPFPSGSNLRFRAPLKLFNGTDTWQAGRIPNARQDLQLRGWVFLGPSHDTPDFEDPVLLKIPSGYHPGTGGHFHFSLPPALTRTSAGVREIVPPENITEPSLYRLPRPNASVTCALGGNFQGYYTTEEGNPKGAAGAGLWDTLEPGWPCAASWLFPFGDRRNPSRTLMIGPILAGFLKFHFLKDAAVNPPAWKLVLAGVPMAAYRPAGQVVGWRSPPSPWPPLNAELFMPHPADPPNRAGYEAARRVMPLDAAPNESPIAPSPGVAFNALFDFMDYPGAGAPYPDPFAGSRRLQTIGSRFLVPGYNLMADADKVGVPGIHPHEDVAIRFGADDGRQPFDNLYFSGDLTQYRIANNNLLSRVTHIVDLGFCQTQAQEDACLAGHLFQLIDLQTDPARVGWWKPRRSGIFFVKRRARVKSGGEPLTLPANQGILLDRNLIVIVDRGDVQITRRVFSERTDGAPTWRFSLVALEGNILVRTTDGIDAYLVALSPGPGDGAGGGRVLADNAGQVLNVFGGVAAWEIGLYPYSITQTTMGSCLGGGVIAYNSRFNPSLPGYAQSRELILEDGDSSMQVVGGR